jgi:hypothetical protein
MVPIAGPHAPPYNGRNVLFTYAESHLGVTPDRALAVILVLNRRNILTD